MVVVKKSLGSSCPGELKQTCLVIQYLVLPRIVDDAMPCSKNRRKGGEAFHESELQEHEEVWLGEF